MNKQKVIVVFNTCTSQYEEVLVSQEIYDEYRRGEWRTRKSKALHRTREVLFSALTGGEDGAYENFKEFVEAINTPEEFVVKKALRGALSRAIAELDWPDQVLIQSLYVEGESELECAAKLGITQQAVSKRKKMVVKKLRKILSSWL